MLLVNEIFHSIQGESTHAGRPCVFVRLTGCPLRCSYCDTAYAYAEGRPMTVAEVLAAVRSHRCDLVEVTGGEPLAQEEVYDLMEGLLAAGYEVLLETSGALPLDRVPPPVRKIVDVKCPGSGEAHRNRLENLDLLSPRDEVKFVLRDRRDFDWAVEVVQRHRLTERCPVLLAPAFGELAPRDLAEWILASGLPLRLQLQIQKYVWNPAARGV